MTCRSTIVALKLLADSIRPYPAILRCSPFPAATAKLLGAVIHPDAQVRGPLSLYEPAWFQVNNNANVRGLILRGPHCCYVGEEAKVEQVRLDADTFFLGDRQLTGKPLTPKVRLTVDFEGCIPFCDPASARGQDMMIRSSRIAESLHSTLTKYGLESTWYVVGQLWDAPAMHPLLSRLVDDPLVNIGWHSHSHPNYISITEAELDHEIEALARTREKTGLTLSSMAFPYNALGHMEALITAGIDSFRGYVGQFYLPKALDFGPFRFFGSSMFVGPNTIEGCRNTLPDPNSTFTYFLHPVDWIKVDATPLLQFVRDLALVVNGQTLDV